MKWQGFLLHHRWKWFTAIPHVEDPPHCGCPNPPIPMQNTQVCAHCFVTGTHAYPWTSFKQGLNNHIPTQRKICFSAKDLNLCSRSSRSLQKLVCSNAVTWSQVSKQLQPSSCGCKWGYFFPRGKASFSRLSALVSWPCRKEGTPGNFGVQSCFPTTPALVVMAKGPTDWLPTCWLPAPLPLLGEVEAADWK